MEVKERPDGVEYRLIEERDLPRASEIYTQSFDKANVGEQWTPETAEKFMRYWFERQPDLFFVAIDEEKIVGGVVAGIKPWWNGNHLVDGELFVDPSFQRKGIARNLLKEVIRRGIEKYNIVEFEGTADGEADYPIRWYERLGIRRNRWAYISGNAAEILENLSSS